MAMHLGAWRAEASVSAPPMTTRPGRHSFSGHLPSRRCRAGKVPARALSCGSMSAWVAGLALRLHSEGPGDLGSCV